MNRITDISSVGAEGKQDRTRRIGSAGLVAVGIRAVDQCLIREIKLGCPIDGCATRQLIPLLIDDAGARIAIAMYEQFAGYEREMLLIFRPTQTSRQLQIVQNIVIGLAKSRIGIQCVGILTEEVVVTFVVQAR